MQLVTGAAAAPEKPRGKVRWIVCSLLFAAVALSYIDRSCCPC